MGVPDVLSGSMDILVLSACLYGFGCSLYSEA